MTAVLVSAIARLALTKTQEPFASFAHSDLGLVVFTQPLSGSHWPFFEYSFFYQPLVGWVIGVLSYVVPSPGVLLVALNVIVAIGAGIVASLLSRTVGPRRTLAFWSLSPQLFLFGGANFDALVVLSLVAATRAASVGRVVIAGAAIALGTATKVLPIIALPPLLLGRWRSDRGAAVRLAAVALGLVLALELPAAAAPYSLLRFGIGAYVTRPWNPDSIWMPIAATLDAMVGRATSDAVVIGTSTLGLAATYALFVVWPAWRGEDTSRLAWVGVCLVLVWTRLYSVQYAIWLLPVFALYVPRARIFALMTAGDVLVYLAVFGAAGFGVSFYDPAQVPFFSTLIIGVIARHVAVVWLFLEARRPRGPLTRRTA